MCPGSKQEAAVRKGSHVGIHRADMIRARLSCEKHSASAALGSRILYQLTALARAEDEAMSSFQELGTHSQVPAGL